MPQNAFDSLSEDESKKVGFTNNDGIECPFNLWTTDGKGDLNQSISLSRKEARKLALFILIQLTPEDEK